MKNKKLTYVLVPAVILVWGLIFYRIFFNQEKSDPMNTYRSDKSLNDTASAEQNDFQLSFHYTDPFLKNIYVPKETEQQVRVFDARPDKSNQRRIVQPRTRTKRIIWPEIVYNGIISDSSLKKLGLISIDKKNVLVNEGVTVQNIVVFGLYRDSVNLIFENDTQTFVKQTLIKE